MKNTSYFLLVATFVIFTSCGPNKKDNITTTPPTAPTSSTFDNQAPANVTDNNNASEQLGTSPIGSGTPTTAVALNPAHGMPNHRCDIEVGAPLNSAPQTNNTAAPKLAPPTPTLPQPVQPAPGTYAAGINPPHGQPGHDCSIAVGAPLKK